MTVVVHCKAADMAINVLTSKSIKELHTTAGITVRERETKVTSKAGQQ